MTYEVGDIVEDVDGEIFILLPPSLRIKRMLKNSSMHSEFEYCLSSIGYGTFWTSPIQVAKDTGIILAEFFNKKRLWVGKGVSALGEKAVSIILHCIIDREKSNVVAIEQCINTEIPIAFVIHSKHGGYEYEFYASDCIDIVQHHGNLLDILGETYYDTKK